MSNLKISKNLRDSMKREEYKIDSSKYYTMLSDDDLVGSKCEYDTGKLTSREDVNRYLNNIVNTSDEYNSEEYMKVAGGSIITSLEKINAMLMDGYVIKRAECLSVDPSMISVVYEKVIKKSEIGKRR